MSIAHQDPALSYDDILAAVKDTARGRWFLENFEGRLRNGNLSRVLDAITRLEDRIEHIAHSSEDAVLVKKAREAISAARRDIAHIEKKPVTLSTEAQLFARLAAQARDAFTTAGNGQGINRALSLVEDLDREFNPQLHTKAPATVSATAAGPSNLFQPDEAIFEAAPVQSPPAPPAADQTRDATARGAKVVFRKTSPAEIPAAPEAAPADGSDQPHGRITVRRTAGEQAEVPLLEEAAGTAA